MVQPFGPKIGNIQSIKNVSVENQEHEEPLDTAEKFHSQECYDLYMYAVGLAKQVNAYLDKGWLVLDSGRPIRKFVFHHLGSPCVAQKYDNVTSIWLGIYTDDRCRVVLSGVDSKNSIWEQFQKIQVFNPKDGKRLLS